MPWPRPCPAPRWRIRQGTPSNHTNNGGLWSAIEEATRDTAAADGKVYVVTGPLYQGSDTAVLQDRVDVPTGI